MYTTANIAPYKSKDYFGIHTVHLLSVLGRLNGFLYHNQAESMTVFPDCFSSFLFF